MELNNLSGTIYADTYRSQRETNFEEYLNTLYSSSDYTDMLEATVAVSYTHLKEMMINLGRSPSGQEYADLMLRQNKILGNMLGADIDFIVRGIDSKMCIRDSWLSFLF